MNETSSRIEKSSSVCLCRNSGQKRRLYDVDESEADTAAATPREVRRLNVDNSERSIRKSGQAASYVTAM